jgi:hypothetical protein
MIPDKCYAVLSSGQVRLGKPRGVTRLGEKLIQADQPIVAYRRRRAQLIDKAVGQHQPLPVS